MNELNLTAPPIPGALEIRTGDAAKLREPVAVRIDGVITAPGLYYSARKSLGTTDPYFDLKTTHVLADLEAGTITLVQNENDPIKTVITGKLTDSKELTELGINAGKSYTTLDLAKALKKIRHLFPSREDAMKLITELSTFKATVTNQIDLAKDARGNKVNSVKTAVETNAPLAIKLTIPLFKGMAPVDVTVDIELDSHGSSVECYLTSIDVSQMQHDAKKNLFKNELAPFKDGGVTIINV